MIGKKLTTWLFLSLFSMTGNVFAHGTDTLAHYKGEIVVTVMFPVGAAAEDVEGFIEKMRSTVPKYEGLDGLISKYYVMSEDNKLAGGVYLWESVSKANAWYTAKWYDYMKKARGEPPKVEYLKAPIVVRNN